MIWVATHFYGFCVSRLSFSQQMISFSPHPNPKFRAQQRNIKKGNITGHTERTGSECKSLGKMTADYVAEFRPNNVHKTGKSNTEKHVHILVLFLLKLEYRRTVLAAFEGLHY